MNYEIDGYQIVVNIMIPDQDELEDWPVFSTKVRVAINDEVSIRAINFDRPRFGLAPYTMSDKTFNSFITNIILECKLKELEL